MNLLLRLFRRKSLERDLERELQFHLDAHVADLMRAGLSREAALREAKLALGGLELVRETTRDARGTRWLEDCVRDSRFALRGMARSPGFTAAVVLTLAIGIGATTAVWSITDALMRRSLPIDRPDELHAIKRVGIEDDNYRMSYPRFQRFRTDFGDSVPLAAMATMIRVYARIDAQPEQVQMQLVSGEWFPLLGIGAAAGRVLGPADNRTMGAHPVAVLSHGFWTRRFGGDRAVIGRTFTINGQSLSVIGVAEPGFRGLTVGQSVDLWVPVVMQHQAGHRIDAFSSNADTEEPWVTQDGIHWLTVLVRTNPARSAPIERRVESRFRAEQQEEYANRDSMTQARAMREHLALEPRPRGFSPLRETFGEPLRMLMAGVGLLLLISCGNIAGLLMARGAARRHEVAVRVSLGARAGRLVRQMLTESIVLAVLGGASGLLVAQWVSSAIVSAVYNGARTVPLAVSIDGGVLAFAAVVTLSTGLCSASLRAQCRRVDLYDGVRVCVLDRDQGNTSRSPGSNPGRRADRAFAAAGGFGGTHDAHAGQRPRHRARVRGVTGRDRAAGHSSRWPRIRSAAVALRSAATRGGCGPGSEVGQPFALRPRGRDEADDVIHDTGKAIRARHERRASDLRDARLLLERGDAAPHGARLHRHRPRRRAARSHRERVDGAVFFRNDRRARRAVRLWNAPRVRDCRRGQRRARQQPS
jgi:hypothetical protein